MGERCRHSRAWPTLYGLLFQSYGFYWCPDCGAIRSAKSNGSEVYPAEPYWIKPGPTWQKDLERNRKAKSSLSSASTSLPSREAQDD